MTVERSFKYPYIGRHTYGKLGSEGNGAPKMWSGRGMHIEIHMINHVQRNIPQFRPRAGVLLEIRYKSQGLIGSSGWANPLCQKLARWLLEAVFRLASLKRDSAYVTVVYLDHDDQTGLSIVSPAFLPSAALPPTVRPIPTGLTVAEPKKRSSLDTILKTFYPSVWLASLVTRSGPYWFNSHASAESHHPGEAQPSPHRKSATVTPPSDCAWLLPANDERMVHAEGVGVMATLWAKCTNGDILRHIFRWITVRSAPIRFVHLKKEDASINGHLQGAKTLADLGCKSPRIPTPTGLEPAPIHGDPEPSTQSPIDKVASDIPNDSPWPEHDVRTRAPYPAAHRGKDRSSDIKDRNRASLMDAPSTGAFWKEVKHLSDPTPVPRFCQNLSMPRNT
ncbi:hypothetical protein DFH07DRAFT_781167 [Mycena maculata]|uniref:Uncharacterized protein n=1 Tax=Mycena maculata TaxID=230809 RepID=A0AAD7HZK7_9AGAR|nr:hypothetical protein DFH07DRAFT_781167 [Mycena maculata]